MLVQRAIAANGVPAVEIARVFGIKLKFPVSANIVYSQIIMHFFSRRQLEQGALPAALGGRFGGGRGGAKGGRCGRSCQVKIGIYHIFNFYNAKNIRIFD